MTKVIIRRKKSVWGCAIKMHIAVDDAQKFDLSNNETKEIDLAIGEHTVKYKVWNRREKSVVINVHEGKEYSLLFKYDPLWGGFKLAKDSTLE
ncbi:MAG: hypothetical protein OSJ70_03935 [Bacilli bacterium]|nr:hypothetical protein [Bacilli bacterium]